MEFFDISKIGEILVTEKRLDLMVLWDDGKNQVKQQSWKGLYMSNATFRTPIAVLEMTRKGT